MSYVSHRRAETRTFDCLYDPEYTVPGAKDALCARRTASTAAAPVRVYANYDSMFVNAPKEMRLLYRKRANVLLPTDSVHGDVRRLPGGGGSDDGGGGGKVGQRTLDRLPQLVPPNVQKLIALMGDGGGGGGGAAGPSAKKHSGHVGSHSIRRQQLCGSTTNVNVINVGLCKPPAPPPRDGRCERFRQQRRQLEQQQRRCRDDDRDSTIPGLLSPAKRACRSRTRATQTLYRESSAQTLPYLPDAKAADPSRHPLDTLEVFRLPSILPGDGPPGLYEVEILERSRKRWAFTEALKANFQRQLKQARLADKWLQHKDVAEAFEWEKWVEREEHIQECQMLRLELLVRMFDRRERTMFEASRDRLAERCRMITTKREMALRKNEIRYRRELRQLEQKRRNTQYNWRKENICEQLGRPESDFYAPQIRFGRNPSRRHFAPDGQRAFDARMGDLAKKAVDMTHLVCPYANLKRLTQPKAPVQEVELNFCSDDHLKKLYDQLKALREWKSQGKTQPKCLIAIESPPHTDEAPDTDLHTHAVADDNEQEGVDVDWVVPLETPRSEPEPATDNTSQQTENSEEELARLYKRYPECERLMNVQMKNCERDKWLMKERWQEEFEAMLAEYEGTAIGWVMEFLGDEENRLQEQRKMHFIAMLAQRERWKREAHEAGLRQKENNMRTLYEQLYQDTTVVNTESCDELLHTIFPDEVNEYAAEEASKAMEDHARSIDEEIEVWLKSFTNIQTPLNFDVLRNLLKDMVFPNAQALRQRYESHMIADYMINAVLLPRIECKLLPYDIASRVLNETVDRLTDNDLLYFSTSSEENSECEICPTSSDTCSCSSAQREADAILRKVVRHAVPGRRWKTPSERMAHDNVADIFDEAFNVIAQKYWTTPQADVLHKYWSYSNLRQPTSKAEKSRRLESDTEDSAEYLLKYNEYNPALDRPHTQHSLRYTDQLGFFVTGDPTERLESFVGMQKSFKYDDEYTQRPMAAIRQVKRTMDFATDFDGEGTIAEQSSSESAMMRRSELQQMQRGIVQPVKPQTEQAIIEYLKDMLYVVVDGSVRPDALIISVETPSHVSLDEQSITAPSDEPSKSDDAEEASEVDDNESILFITAEELRRLYFDTSCKCDMRRERDERMREKANKGKMRIVNPRQEESDIRDLPNLDYESLKEIIKRDWSAIAGPTMMDDFKNGISGIVRATIAAGFVGTETLEEMKSDLEMLIKSKMDLTASIGDHGGHKMPAQPATDIVDGSTEGTEEVVLEETQASTGDMAPDIVQVNLESIAAPTSEEAVVKTVDHGQETEREDELAAEIVPEEIVAAEIVAAPDIGQEMAGEKEESVVATEAAAPAQEIAGEGEETPVATTETAAAGDLAPKVADKEAAKENAPADALPQETAVADAPHSSRKDDKLWKRAQEAVNF